MKTDTPSIVSEAGGGAEPANRTNLRRRFTINPITRLEGHGKIEIFLDEKGEVERAFMQVPELRGFEVFCQGRPAEDMPQLTSRICGVCPTAHHMASAKALDNLYRVGPPPAARKIRELVYNAFMLEDHPCTCSSWADRISSSDPMPRPRNGIFWESSRRLGSKPAKRSSTAAGACAS